MSNQKKELYMGYEKKLTVYIDILGTKESKYDELYKINKIFHNELVRIRTNEMFCKKFTTSFSDCACIIYEINEHNENNENETTFYYYIHESLTDLAYTITTIQINGFLCRGGISYNDLYYDEGKNIVFGPAINEAYKLETEAIMPRIIFNDILGNKLYKNNIIKDKFLRLIRKDEFDNRYYLNFLYAFSQFDYMDYDEGLFDEKIPLGEEKYSFDECYNILKTKSVETIKNNIDHKVIAKHKWQLKYLLQHRKERIAGPHKYK
jgi:hypothetical protein